jgi:hypothetical protein
VREAKIASEPAAIIGWFASLGLDLSRIGLEAVGGDHRQPHLALDPGERPTSRL